MQSKHFSKADLEGGRSGLLGYVSQSTSAVWISIHELSRGRWAVNCINFLKYCYSTFPCNDSKVISGELHF